ncbi:MAG: hypothetical protein ACN4GM_16665 [Gammaproteobacteria bacterium]
MQITINTGLVEKYFRLGFVSLALLALISCSTGSQQPRWDPLGETAVDPTGLDRSLNEISPAVQRLIQQADQAIDNQDWLNAIATLERALRINPKQAETWSRLSVANYGNQQYQQAIQMARRSNSHIMNNNELKAYNWLMMARAYEQLGDMEQSTQAAATSQQLQQEAR